MSALAVTCRCRRSAPARWPSNEDIEILVNNAGVGAVFPLVESDADQIERMIDVNITALTRLTYAFVPQVIRRGVGTVVNIGSVVGTAPEILNGVYGASKAYVLAFTQSLHQELAGPECAHRSSCPTPWPPPSGTPPDGRLRRP